MVSQRSAAADLERAELPPAEENPPGIRGRRWLAPTIKAIADCLAMSLFDMWPLVRHDIRFFPQRNLDGSSEVGASDHKQPSREKRGAETGGRMGACGEKMDIEVGSKQGIRQASRQTRKSRRRLVLELKECPLIDRS